MPIKKVILIVLDGVGCGGAPDAESYGDVGANTLRHVVEGARPSLVTLQKMGLGNIPDTGLKPIVAPMGAYGRLTERSAGKDTTTGHWEIAGLALDTPFPVFPDGFPKEVMEPFEKAIGRGTLGNYTSSGTAILDALGKEHLETGKPIVYTSADSVFQVAAHEDVIPPNDLWMICETARSILSGSYAVGRVIARPFIGKPGAFTRTGNRRDFSVVPHGDTMLDILSANKFDVMGIGKIEDIFAHRGLTRSDHASGNDACIASLLAAMEQPVNGLIFVNLVDFDMLYGHRNDVRGFAEALDRFDAALPDILARMQPDDLLMITADHGCDPTFPGTDHTRENVPILCYGEKIRATDLGTRASFADIASTVLEAFDLRSSLAGTSFFKMLQKKER